jgi:hypothetical protein
MTHRVVKIKDLNNHIQIKPIDTGATKKDSNKYWRMPYPNILCASKTASGKSTVINNIVKDIATKEYERTLPIALICLTIDLTIKGNTLTRFKRTKGNDTFQEAFKANENNDKMSEEKNGEVCNIWKGTL